MTENDRSMEQRARLLDLGVFGLSFRSLSFRSLKMCESLFVEESLKEFEREKNTQRTQDEVARITCTILCNICLYLRIYAYMNKTNVTYVVVLPRTSGWYL